MLFDNLLFAVALTAVWPLGMLGLLAACAWLERRTLVAEEVIPRRLRRMEGKPPEEVEAMVLLETHEVIADYWSTPTHPYLGTAPSPNGRRPAAGEPAAEPAPPAEDPAPRLAVWPRGVGAPRPAEARRQPEQPASPEPPAPPAPPRAAPSRVGRLVRRRPKGRHERR